MKIDVNPMWKRDLPKDVLNRIRLNDERNLSGETEIFVNPAYDNVPDSEIKEFVYTLMDKGRLTEKLLDIEESNLSKLGPRSRSVPWSERRDSVKEYFRHETIVREPLLESKSLGRAEPVTRETAISKLLRSSSAGLPYLTRKGKVIDEGSPIDNIGEHPCMLYTRTQEDWKTRNVWGYPIADTVWEQQFHIRFLGFEKTLANRSALRGPDHVDRAITDLILAKQRDNTIYCVDFSGYDASVSPGLIHRAFNFIANIFQPQYEAELYDLYERFSTIPLLTPDGEFQGPHGVPSGSSFTNTVDSLVQLIVSNRWLMSQVQGDDGVYLVPDRDVETLVKRFTDAGLSVNADKSDSFADSHEAVYLQRYYHPDYQSETGGLGGVYSVARALNRIKYLEKWTDVDKEQITGSDFFALRTITILENCKHHPHFRDLVEYVHGLDKYDLKFTESGLKAYSRMLESKARAGVIHQYGDGGGIENFATMRILKTL